MTISSSVAMIDFRALCVELLEAAEDMTVLNDDSDARFEAVATRARAALAQPAPPAEGPRELQWPASVAQGCHEAAAEAKSGSPLQQLLVAAGDLLERCHPTPVPVPVSERLPGHVEQALIKAECALSDIAEGEPEENEGDSDALLSWAEQRAAAVLARIRPVMREHGIRTSEWPPLPAHSLPLPAGEVQP